jgi:hypothetical protein
MRHMRAEVVGNASAVQSIRLVRMDSPSHDEAARHLSARRVPVVWSCDRSVSACRASCVVSKSPAWSATNCMYSLRRHGESDGRSRTNDRTELARRQRNERCEERRPSDTNQPPRAYTDRDCVLPTARATAPFLRRRVCGLCGGAVGGLLRNDANDGGPWGVNAGRNSTGPSLHTTRGHSVRQYALSPDSSLARVRFKCAQRVARRCRGRGGCRPTLTVRGTTVPAHSTRSPIGSHRSPAAHVPHTVHAFVGVVSSDPPSALLTAGCCGCCCGALMLRQLDSSVESSFFGRTQRRSRRTKRNCDRHARGHIKST